MAGFIPAIHVLKFSKKDVDARDIGEQSDAVLRTAMPGHDGRNLRVLSSASPHDPAFSAFSISTFSTLLTFSGVIAPISL